MEKIHKSVQENYQDSGFYIASLGCTSFQNNLPQTKLYLSFSDYKEYYEQSHTYNMYIIENILYSPKENGELYRQMNFIVSLVVQIISSLH